MDILDVTVTQKKESSECIDMSCFMIELMIVIYGGDKRRVSWEEWVKLEQQNRRETSAEDDFGWATSHPQPVRQSFNDPTGALLLLERVKLGGRTQTGGGEGRPNFRPARTIQIPRNPI